MSPAGESPPTRRSDERTSALRSDASPSGTGLDSVRWSGITHGLSEIEPGYFVRPNAGVVSYPESGHATCHAMEDSSYWFRHRASCVVAALGRFPPDGPIVDVGGGNGHVARAMRDAGHEVVLVEPGEEGARNAYDRGLRPVIQATFEGATLRPGSLSAIGMFDVLEHIENDEEFLVMVREKLRPNGRLFLTVPAYQRLWSQEDVDAGHYRRYSTRSLRDVAASAGLELEYSTHLFWLLPAPIAIARTIAGRLGLRRGGSPARRRLEYVAPAATLDMLVSRLLALEVALVRRGRGVPIGSSLLAVARRLT